MLIGIAYLAPDYLAKKFKKRFEIHNKDTRDKNKNGYRTVRAQRTFHYRAVSISLWNSLPERFTELTKLASLKKVNDASFTRRTSEALL